MDAQRLREVETQKKLRIRSYQITCRLSTACLMGFAAINMVVDKEISNYGSVKMEANYSSISAFRFFVGLCATASAYSLLSLVFFSSWNVRMTIIYVLDLTATSLAMGAVASSSAAAHIGKFGEAGAGWPPVCGFFPRFCNQAAFSLVLCFFGFCTTYLATSSLVLAMAAP